jgi:hypothetical protein
LLLKAFLLHHTGRFPNEHDLMRLLALVQHHDPTVTLPDAEERILTQVNTFNFSRYPVPTKPVPIGDEDWDGIEQLWHTLARRLPLPHPHATAQGSAKRVSCRRGPPDGYRSVDAR